MSNTLKVGDVCLTVNTNHPAVNDGTLVVIQLYASSSACRGSATDRTWIRGVMDQVQDRLKADGIEITNADLQAVLWYYEKDLYDRLIGKGQDVETETETETQETKEAEDYETAARYTVARLQREGLVAGSAGSARPGADTGGAGAPGAGDPTDGRPEQAGDRRARYSSGGPAPLEGAPDVRGAAGPDPRLVNARRAVQGQGLTREPSMTHADGMAWLHFNAAYRRRFGVAVPAWAGTLEMSKKLRLIRVACALGMPLAQAVLLRDEANNATSLWG